MVEIGAPNQRVDLNGEQLDVAYNQTPTIDGQVSIEPADPNSNDPRVKIMWHHNGSYKAEISQPLGSAGSNVSEALRVWNGADGAVNYFPIAKRSVAAYPELPIKHNGEVYALHDTFTADDPAGNIPDSVIYQFDGRELSGLSSGETVSELPDISGVTGAATNGSASYDPDIRNGNAGVQFTGSEDYDLTLDSNIAQPFVIYSVIDLGDTSSNRVILGPSSTPPDSQHWWRANDNSFGVRSGDTVGTTASDTNALLVTTVHDGSNSDIYTDNILQDGGDAGTDSLGDSTIGSRGGSEYYDGGLMFLEVHNSRPYNGVGSRGQEILDQFN